MQGHPEEPDPLYGALAFSKSEMASMPLFEPGATLREMGKS